MSAFAKGAVIQVYDDPLTRTRPGFVARVLKVVEDDCGAWEGRALRRYRVQPSGAGESPTEVVALDDPEAE